MAEPAHVVAIDDADQKTITEYAKIKNELPDEFRKSELIETDLGRLEFMRSSLDKIQNPDKRKIVENYLKFATNTATKIPGGVSVVIDYVGKSKQVVDNVSKFFTGKDAPVVYDFVAAGGIIAGAKKHYGEKKTEVDKDGKPIKTETINLTVNGGGSQTKISGTRDEILGVLTQLNKEGKVTEEEVKKTESLATISKTSGTSGTEAEKKEIKSIADGLRGIATKVHGFGTSAAGVLAPIFGGTFGIIIIIVLVISAVILTIAWIVFGIYAIILAFRRSLQSRSLIRRLIHATMAFYFGPIYVGYYYMTIT